VKKISNFPEIEQAFDYDCGACAMQAVLEYYGIDLREEKFIKLLGTTKKYGTAFKGFKKAAKKFKLKSIFREMSIDMLKKNIDLGRPTIIALQAWPDRKTTRWEKHWSSGHYVIPIGYDKKKIYFDDPSVLKRAYLTFKELEKRWHDVDGKSKKRYSHMGISFYGRKPKYNLDKTVHMR